MWYIEKQKKQAMKNHIKLFEAFQKGATGMEMKNPTRGARRDEYIKNQILPAVQAKLKSISGWKYDSFEWQQAGSFAFRRGKLSLYVTPFWSKHADFEPILMVGSVEWSPLSFLGGTELTTKRIPLTGSLEKDVEYVTSLVMGTVEKLAYEMEA